MPSDNNHMQEPAFRLTEFLPYKLSVVSGHGTRLLAESFIHQFNLTVAEWRVMTIVAEQGQVSPTSVGLHTAMDKVKVSRAAQGLANKGMLRQRPNPRDGRSHLLRLTRKGTTTHAATVPVAIQLQAILFDGVTRAELAAFARVLTIITARFETFDEAAPSA